MQRVLETGWLRPKHEETRGRRVRYRMACLDENYLPQVMELQSLICQVLQRPDLLHPFSKDFMMQHMGRQGTVLGVFVKDRLVAFRNLYYPSPEDRQWNLGLDIGLSKAKLAQVVNLQMVCVHPDFRGNRLALKMNRTALRLLRAHKTHPHVCATVSPFNIWNIPVLLSCGFSIVKLKRKYGGKIRYIVYQNLIKPLNFVLGGVERVALDDLETQRRLLDSGYFGVNVRPGSLAGGGSGTGLELVFKKHLRATALQRVLQPAHEMAAV
jgi:hypothetical protein